MAGQVWGLIESYTNTGSANNNTRNVAAAIYAAFEHARNSGSGPLERVASYYGANGTGFNFIGQANPIGDNGFFVYKLKPSGSRVYSIYILVQWGTNTANFGSGSATPGHFVNNATKPYGVGIAFAVALTSGGADANPWQGGTAFNGADAKGSTVWAAPGGGLLFVYPRSNNAGGTHAVNKQNCAVITDIENNSPTSAVRTNIVGDDDNLAIAVDNADDNTYQLCVLLDLKLADNLTIPVNHVFMNWNGQGGTFSTQQAYGSTASSTATEGAVVGYDGTSYRVFTIWESFDTGYLTSTFQPSPQQAGVSRYDQVADINICVNEAPYKGFVGRTNGFLKVVQNVAVHDRSSDYKYVVLGGGVALVDFKFTFPWDGGSTNPKSGVTLAGVTFRRSP